MKLVEQLQAYTEPVFFTGDGVIAFEDFLKEKLGARAIMAPQKCKNA